MRNPASKDCAIRFIIDAVLLLGLIGAFWLSLHSRIQLQDVVRLSSQGEITPLPHEPFLFDGNSEEFWINATFEVDAFTNPSIRLIPDDCLQHIEINGIAVDLSAYPEAQLCDYKRGIKLDTSPFIQSGRNKISLLIQDRGWRAGLKTQFVFGGFPSLLGPLAMVLLLITLIWRWTSRLKWIPAVQLIFIAAVLMRLAYWSYTDYDTHSHDVDGHLEYIQSIWDHKAVPSASECWTCYHPPLYYLSGTFVKKAALLLGLELGQSSLQTFALAIDLTFMAVVVQILGKLCWSSYFWAACSLLACFWPSGVFHSIRIGNDGIAYLFIALTLNSTLDWCRSDNRRDFVKALLFTAFAFISKANALFLMPILGMVYLWKRSFHARTSFRNVCAEILLTVLILTTFTSPLWLRIIENNMKDSSGDLLVSNSSGLGSGLTVGKEFRNFAYFDSLDMLDTPFTRPFEDVGGRQYFWNYMFKTSLFGEWSHNIGAQQTYARIIVVLFLCSLFCFVIGFLRYPFATPGAGLLLGTLLFSAVASLMALRYRIPAACSNDFRYIYPVLIAFIPWVYSGLCVIANNVPWVGKLISVAFLLAWMITVLLFHLTPLFQ
jgi:hypothetical protein